LETIGATKKQQNLKNGIVRFLLNIEVREEMEDSRLNAIKQLITFVKGRLNFSCKSTTAANVDLTESLLDNWLKNNHITVGKSLRKKSMLENFRANVLKKDVLLMHFSSSFWNVSTHVLRRLERAAVVVKQWKITKKDI